MDLFEEGKIRAEIKSRKQIIKITVPIVIGILYIIIAAFAFVDEYEDRQRKKQDEDCSMEMNKQTLEVEFKC